MNNHNLRGLLPWLQELLLAMALVISVAAQPAWAAAEHRPNVLLIVSDDLNADLGCYGHPIVKSPNIDRIAARGVRFDHAYCQFPLCNPSRASFLSGRRPDTTGIVNNSTALRTYLKDTTLLPQYFREKGYKTLKVGKINHTGKSEDPRSWDVDNRETKGTKDPPKAQILRRQGVMADKSEGPDGIVLKVPDEEVGDGMAARRAAQVLNEAAAAKKPFFMGVGFRRPHRPYAAPEKYFNLYPPEAMPVPKEPPEHLQNIPPAALTYRPGVKQMSERERQETTAAYYASVSFMDANVGVVLDAVDKLKLWDNTIVVFMSDHGYHLGEHGGLQHKMSLFEESARVPLIVAAPGKKASVASPRLVEYVDLYPTLTDLCGLPLPEGLEGASFAPLLSDPNRSWKKAAFTQVVTDKKKINGRSVRTQRWRYTEWDDGKQGVELYDQENDPKEYRNLAKDPSQEAIVAEMKQLLHAGWKAALPPTN